jgi:molybdopterin-guanine dinucleotide biosynthesis protein A
MDVGDVPQRDDMLGVVLAGGLSRRMNLLPERAEVDKGLLPLAGRVLAAWVVDRLKPQVGEVVINANRHLADWNRLGVPVIADLQGGHVGPLAGLEAALDWIDQRAERSWVLIVPCDGPFFPTDLASRLSAAAQAQSVPLVIARTPSRLHPVYLLAHRDMLRPLRSALAAGQRAMTAWIDTQNHAEVTFDDEAAFANLNTPADFEAAHDRSVELTGRSAPRMASPS